MIKSIMLMAAAIMLPLSGATAHETYHDNQRQCKNFNDKVRINGKRQQVKGVACLNHHGEWEVVSDNYDKYSNDYDNRYYHSRSQYSSSHSPVYVPSLGFRINFGNYFAYNQKDKYRNRNWRGGNYINNVRKQNKRRWKKRGGNSYSLLTRKNNITKR